MPLVARDRVIGAISLITSSESGRVLGDEDLALAIEIAGRAAVAVENARLFSETELQRAVLERQGEASVDGLLLVSPDGAIISSNRRYSEIWELGEHVLAQGDDATLEAAVDKVADPDAFVARVREVYATRETSREELRFRDGRTIERYGAPVTASNGDYVGYLWSFRDVTERVRSEQRLAFLSRASVLLAESLDLDETLTRVAALAFPVLADFCVFDVLDAAGEIRQVAASHRAEGRADFSAEMGRHVAPLDHPRHPVSTAIRTRETQLLTGIDDGVLAAIGADPTHSEFLRSLGVTSYLAVPLVLGQQTIGAVTFAFSESGRVHTASDVSLAEELARRAAVAVENARLYAETEARAQAAQALEFVGDGVFLVGADGVIRLWNPAAERITGLRLTRPRRLRRRRRPRDVAPPRGGRAAAHLPDRGRRPRALARAHRGPVRGRHRLRVPRPDRGAGARAAEERLRLDGLARAADAARGDLRRCHDAPAHGRRAPRRAAPRPARRGRERVGTARADRQRRPLGEPARRGRARRLDRELRRGRARRCRRRGGAGAPAGRDRARPRRRVETCRRSRPTRTRCARCSSTSSTTPSSTRPTEARWRACRAAGRRVRFSVADRGLGIPPSEHERIFEKFFRLDPNLTRGVGGTGLGLYICRELVRRMDGRICVESREGEGSTFSFELPVA